MPSQAAHPPFTSTWPDGIDCRAHPDTLSVLMEFQDAIRRLIQRIEVIASIAPAQAQSLRARLTRRLCLEMSVQLQVEQELLLPRLRAALDDPAPVEQAQAEHDRLCQWVERLLERDLDKPDGDDRARTLGLLFARHLRRELIELHALAGETDLDWRELGQRIQRRRNRLLVAGPRAGKAELRSARRSCS